MLHLVIFILQLSNPFETPQQPTTALQSLTKQSSAPAMKQRLQYGPPVTVSPDQQIHPAMPQNASTAASHQQQPPSSIAPSDAAPSSEKSPSSTSGLASFARDNPEGIRVSLTIAVILH